jgi:hypothetical protein
VSEGERGPFWSSTASGLFSDRPHLCLEERFWDAASCTTTNRYYIVDAETCEVTRYASTSQAYTDGEFRTLLTECGFTEPEFYPSLTGDVDESQRDLYVLVARKREG